ncbi:hypothetical protein AMOR_10960 [Anaeromyxobacter oryzae]|uniref:DUF4136 domain-containing protein n=2 Tax=Anaeromyxobacter oryzae TaxID=2918170 RepID=A0ABM7WRK2_9BACT|nr:hypothetical protein AMOR_10960 [Anaeromyxobacter oryzae]
MLDGFRRACAGATVLAAAAVVAAAAGCASAPLADGPSGPPPFRNLRRVVLVRAIDHAEPHRAKDPLDAVRESLEAKGRTTRTVEVGARLPPELAGLSRLYSDVEVRIDDGFGPDFRTRRTDRLGKDVGPLLGGLEADGAVLYYRFGARPLPPAALSSPFGRDPELRLARPLGALAVVDRDGNLLWFDWGAPDTADRDPAAPSTAAEAVDALLRVIDGDGDEAPGA